jgi:hypothetical protein
MPAVAEDRAVDAFTHLQGAALQFIAALRAVLDVAEEAVRDPGALRDVVTATAMAASQAAAQMAGEATAQVVGQAADRAGGHTVPDSAAGPTDPEPDPPTARGRRAPVEHIRIS